MEMTLVQWICGEMTALLGMTATEDIAEYILSIETAEELEAYISELFDQSVPEHRRFLQELLQRWTSTHKAEQPQHMQAYRKSDIEGSYVEFDKTRKKGKKSPVTSDAVVNTTTMMQGAALHSGSTGKKTKFVSLFSEEGAAKTVAKLPGRHVCECQAAKHPLVNNCLRCGRVVCEQEGSGPCIFCGNLVCTRSEMETLSAGSKKSDRLRLQLMQKGRATMPTAETSGESKTNNKGFEAATKQKDRLLEYDKSSVKRTQVIDDESDYFATDVGTWLSSGERAALSRREEELRARRHASRLDRKVVLDFAGRRVLDEDEAAKIYNREEEVTDMVVEDFGDERCEDGRRMAACDDIVNPNITLDPPKFVSVDDAYATRLAPIEGSGEKDGRTMRLQDRQIQEMSDDGYCLSMHQPWASLLIKGIKKHEGRSWYSAHRGRLWIAATKQCASVQEIVDLEQHYKELYNDDTLSFPRDYPVSCLLGCVNVLDCLEQQQYRQQYPSGDSDSPYVFICEAPEELIVKFPIRGKLKIYKLPSYIHQAAKKGLRRALTNG